jgi:ketosteroid isomerase-like protein
MRKRDDTTANKLLVRNFFAALSKGPEPTLPLLAEEVIWWTAPYAYTKREWAKIETLQYEHLATPVVLEVKSMIAEGDCVAAETESHGLLKNGRVYANKYCWVFRIGAGKILRIHEHCDTLHAVRTFEGVLPLYEGQEVPVPAQWPVDI